VTSSPAYRTRTAVAAAQRTLKAAHYLVVALIALVYLFPLFYLANTSLKESADYFTDPVALVTQPTLHNFTAAWEMGRFGGYVVNSVIYTAAAAGLGTLLSLLLAYPIARNYVRGSSVLYGLFVAALFLPLSLPIQFQLMLALGLYNTQIGYVLLMTSELGIGPFLIANYLRGVPQELDQAAAVDGCGYFRFVFQFVLPMSRPALVTVFVLHAIGVWNDIVFATIYLTDPGSLPITRGLFAFYGEYGNDWALLSAAVMIVALPLIVVYIVLQRYIVGGATAGALKS